MTKNNSIFDELVVSVPKYIANLQLPDPAILNYYKDIEDRTLWITGDIDDDLVELGKSIIRWNSEDKGKSVDERKPIKIMIYSNGGSLTACLNLVDIIMCSKTPVYGFNMGAAFSAAFIILIACHRRFCLPNSTALYHEGGAGMSGTADQVVNFTDNYKSKLKDLKEFIVSRTQITKQLLKRKEKIDWYIESDEQVQLGICESKITEIEQLM